MRVHANSTQRGKKIAVIVAGTVFQTENSESGKTHFERERVRSHVSSHNNWYFRFYSEGLGDPWLFGWRIEPKWAKIKGIQDRGEPSTATQVRSEK